MAAAKLKDDILNVLDITAGDVREIIRYDIEGLSDADFERAKNTVFSEPPVDTLYEESVDLKGYSAFVIEYLPGQYDQRADSAAQCVQLLTLKPRITVKCARVIAVKGVDNRQLEKIKGFLINPVECREGGFDKPQTLAQKAVEVADVAVIKGFTDFSNEEIKAYHKQNGFAMSVQDLAFVRDWFASEKRNPTVTEIKVIDTYWSDHCRHTTFLTELTKIDINAQNPHIKKAYDMYKGLFDEMYANRADKYPCLMDIATIAAKKLKKEGKLQNLDVSDEINACSVEVDVDVNGRPEKWLVMFKNETHNHPTEIEPFGGAATCLGGAIRDPLSGRVYVYQAMRVTGAANPLESIEKTLEGKLPQRVITKGAAAGYSSYGNQIGLATGLVNEMYHEGYKAKRLEAGYVIGAAPKANVVREKPVSGDVVLLLGGDTGRDGCGGATGSSKAHDTESIVESGAEVQKGNPLTERKIQRLFRNKEAANLIIKCNDFGAGGVSVAIGELADGLLIDLDKVPKKYEGLDGTELAISESQERMAVVVKPQNVKKFIKLAAEENLNCAEVAKVTDDARMRMLFKGREIVNLSRAFLDTNGVKQQAAADIDDGKGEYFGSVDKVTDMLLKRNLPREALLNELTRLNVCSQKGMAEMFDSTIGAGTLLMPFGGFNQLSPENIMAAKPPVKGETDTATCSAYGCNPYLNESSPFLGAIYSIVTSLSKLVAAGVDFESIRLSLQEFFEKPKDEPARWGKPASALLGALYAQLGLGVAAIGGKDSMSGSFNELDVPPTLISFAMGIGRASKLVSATFGKNGKLVWLPLKKDENNVPDFEYLKRLYKSLNDLSSRGKIYNATVIGEGGIAAAAVKACMGEGKGVNFSLNGRDLFAAYFGDILAVVENEKVFDGLDYKTAGVINDTPKVIIGGEILKLDNAVKAFESTLEPVYPTTAPAAGFAKNLGVSYTKKRASEVKYAKPSVFIPAFPGTNCEYDTARAFERAGAKVRTLIVKNQTEKDIADAAQEIARLVSESQIIAFPGGFSGGDEPDGSGKFIATTFRNPVIAEQVMKLLDERDGLMLGICNGFQALIKMGLVPYGKISAQDAKSPTLTFNNISRHVSEIVRIRVASNLSPWLSAVNVGDVYAVPVSHGEGRFVAPDKVLSELVSKGQIATQYADLNGNATMDSPYNPNGSMMAAEGITSPDGRIFGKMGHAERTGKNLYGNYSFEFDMKIFESGVKYFK